MRVRSRVSKTEARGDLAARQGCPHTPQTPPALPPPPYWYWYWCRVPAPPRTDGPLPWRVYQLTGLRAVHLAKTDIPPAPALHQTGDADTVH